MVAAAPAAAQFGSIFGDPPRPPSAVPGRRDPRAYPPSQNYPQSQPQYDPGYERAPPPPGYSGYPQSGYPQSRYPQPGSNPAYQQPSEPGVPPPQQQQGTVAPGQPAPSAPTNFESQPLPPPPGGAADTTRPPAPASSQPAAALPPGTAAPPSASPPAGATAVAPPGAPRPPSDDAVTVVPTQKVPNPIAVFSGLDKITGRITTFDVRMDETVQFGALRVRPRACYTRLPTDAPNTTGFVEVDEVTLQGEVKGLFRGWMFASSPGLHGVEHPIYDVWLSDCKGSQATAAVEQGPTAGTEVPPPDAPPGAQRRPSVPTQPVPVPRRPPQ